MLNGINPLDPSRFIDAVYMCATCEFQAVATLATATIAKTIQEAIELAWVQAVPHLIAYGVD